MLPIVLSNPRLNVGLAGSGEPYARRLSWLREGGLEPTPVSAADDLAGFHLLFVAGATAADASALSARARQAGVLVHVEDRPSLCDFYAPALVRRGDLVIAISTGGRAPALTKLIRQWVEARFDALWGARVDDAGKARARWQSEGVGAAEMARRTQSLVENRGWLA